jgi:hypothetical protein
MATSEQHNLSVTPAQEAQRYLENARKILAEKAGKKDGLYADVKYVKMAAGTAYSAALLILDEYLLQKRAFILLNRRASRVTRIDFENLTKSCSPCW